jgi:hypothetical protein
MPGVGRAERPARAAIAEANRLALEAVRNDDHDSYAHFTLGTALSCAGQPERRWTSSAARWTSIRTSPRRPASSAGCSPSRAAATKPIEHAQRAIESSPSDPHLSLWLRSQAIACFVGGRHDEAVRYARKRWPSGPTGSSTTTCTRPCLAAAGEMQRAAAAMAEGAAPDAGIFARDDQGRPPVHRPGAARAFCRRVAPRGLEG